MGRRSLRWGGRHPAYQGRLVADGVGGEAGMELQHLVRREGEGYRGRDGDGHGDLQHCSASHRPSHSPSEMRRRCDLFLPRGSTPAARAGAGGRIGSSVFGVGGHGPSLCAPTVVCCSVCSAAAPPRLRARCSESTATWRGERRARRLGGDRVRDRGERESELFLCSEGRESQDCAMGEQQLHFATHDATIVGA
jgi:hypothetical protein